MVNCGVEEGRYCSSRPGGRSWEVVRNAPNWRVVGS
jgi:hypothetical protein